jgi:aspartate aminotransferase
MEKMLSHCVKRIKPSPTLAVTARAAELKAAGLDIIGLGAGEPDFDTPDNIKKAAVEAINKGKTKYTDVDGTKELKLAIIEKFKRENELSYEVDQITVGNGAKQVLFNAMLATLNPGDEVIIPAPYWVSYPDMVALTQGIPVIITCDETQGFKLNPEQLRDHINDKTKWVILNSPSNPTGATYTEQELKALAKVLLEFPHVHIMSDDIYEHILYDGFKFTTIAQVEPKLKERCLTINGVSKSHSMTGWRVGFGAGPKWLIKAIAKIQSQSTSNPCSISQAAAVEALTGDQSSLETQKEVFQKRRDMVVEMLNEIPGIECPMPEGAFYVFPSCKGLIGKKIISDKCQLKEITNSNDFAQFLLEEAGVAVVAGSAFGLENFFRISYATADLTLQKACTRIKNACKMLM